MREFHLKYGQGEVSFSIPQEQLLYEILGKEYPPLADVVQAARQAMAEPIDSPPLAAIVKPGEKVVITVSDITRGWQQMSLILPEILAVLNGCGVPDENITVIVAVGGHRQNTREEFAQLCGAEVCRRVKVVNHDAWDEGNMVYYGRTSRGTDVWINKLAAQADRLILTGGIIYHYMAGYGGGRKSIMPGVSSIKTIRRSHLWALGPELGDGSNPRAASKRTEGNYVHEDMMEIASLLRLDFIINMVPAPEGGIAGIFAGHWISAWEQGCRLVDWLYGVEIHSLADIVVVSAGGFPKDINLYQTGKPMDNAFYAVKKGGAVIIVSECQDIYDPAEFSDWFQYEDILTMEAALRDNFGIPGWVALKELECARHATYIFVTRAENTELLTKIGMIATTSIEEALAIAREKCAAAKPLYTVMPQGANTLPILKS